MKALIAASIALLISATTAVAQTHNLNEAPDSIKALSKTLENKSPEDVLRAIVKQLGAPSRDRGSGVHILEWDVPEGLLVYNSHAGPTFFDRQHSKAYRLLKTTNPVAFNVLGTYEMLSVAARNGPDTVHYLGRLHIDGEWNYRFGDSNQQEVKRAGQENNFFLLNPVGRVSIEFIPPFESGLLLENIPEGALIAQLRFQPNSGKDVATFRLSSSELRRELSFAASSVLTFQMRKPWNSQWN